MKALILAAGYGTRMYPVTSDKPKALLALATKTVVEHIISRVLDLWVVDEIYIATNARFFEQFEKWKRGFQCEKTISILSDGTLSNEHRLGVAEEIDFVLKQKKINEDLLVIGSDNFFDFSLVEMYQFFQQKNTSIVALCDLSENEKLARKFGVVELDRDNKIIHFEEKPEQPKTSLASTACYMFLKEDLTELEKYLLAGQDRDNLGQFIKWLCSKKSVHGFIFDGTWYDIGTPDQFEEAKNVLNEKEESLRTIVDTLMDESQNEKKKVIFVFGAGASVPSGIPDGKFLKEKLLGFLRSLETTEKIRKAIEKMPRRFKDLSQAPLEYLVALGCEAYEEGIMIDWLTQYIPDIYKSRIKYFPSIAYEFITHLMANDLIRYVVNLNYDELLDKAIDDELGEGRCYRVSTLEEFGRLARDPNWDRISDYFIIKPHGTMSLPNSLRHRYEHTLKFEKQKATVLRKLFKDAILVLIGYQANDEDFKLLFYEDLLLGNISKAIVVKGKPESVVAPISPDIREQYVSSYKGRSDKFCKELAEKLYEHEKYKHYYTKATRHFIRCALYQKLAPEPQKSGKRRQRLEKNIKKDPLFFTKLNLLLEILIFCFKARGLFTNTAFMSCQRIVSALREHIRNEKPHQESAVKNIVDSLLKDGKRAILRKKEIEKTLGSCWYYLPKNKTTPSGVKELYVKSAKKALDMLNAGYFKKVSGIDHEINKLAETFYELQNDFDYDLGKSYIPYFLFQDPKIIESRIDFKKTDEKILKIRTNSRLYITSATGEWLRQYKHLLTRFTEVKVMVSKDILDIKDSIHFDHVGSFLRELMKSSNVEFRKLGNLAHHMTLGFKIKGREVEGRALYFHREGKASSFTPVYLENKQDIKMLKRFFSTSWEDADEIVLP